MATYQLPLSIPEVAQWYQDVENHSEKCNNDGNKCKQCEGLRSRMRTLCVRFADQLKKI